MGFENLSGLWKGAAHYQDQQGQVGISVTFLHFINSICSLESTLRVELQNIPSFQLSTEWVGEVDGHSFTAKQTNALGRVFSYEGYVSSDRNQISGFWVSHQPLKNGVGYPSGKFLLTRSSGDTERPAEKEHLSLSV